MDALFIHDHIFYTINGNHYSQGGLPSTTWSRYLKHFDSLTVIARGKKVDDDTGLVLSSAENIEFKLFYSAKGGLDYFKYQKSIKVQLLMHITQSDAIIIRLPSSIGTFAADLCRKIQKPYVAEIVGCAWDSIWNYGTLLHKIYAPYAYYKMQKIVRNSMAALYVTENFLQKRYPASGIQAFASDVQIKNTLDDTLQNHIDYINRKNYVFKIGIIGNLSVKYKGYDTALNALRLLKNLGIKFRFYLVGGGDQEYVKRLIDENNLQNETVIAGKIQSGDAIFRFLDELDLYIHPSRQEGLPRSVIEAMSRACPVIASNAGGIPELLPNEYMHNPNDYRKLFLLMQTVFNDKRQLIAMSERNFIKSKEYMIDILKERIDTFYGNVKSLIEERK